MAAVRLSRLQKRILRWLAADEQRTRGMITSSHPELAAALPSAKGNLSHSLRRLETQGLIVMTRARLHGRSVGIPPAMKLISAGAAVVAIVQTARTILRAFRRVMFMDPAEPRPDQQHHSLATRLRT